MEDIRPIVNRKILGMRVDFSSYDDAVERVLRAAEKRQPFWLCPASVHTVIERHHNSMFREVMDSASLVTTDGVPLVWTLRILGIRRAQRVYGPTLTERVLECASNTEMSVGFYGSSQRVIETMAVRLKQRWPRLHIAYAHAPPYRRATPEEDLATVRNIQESGVRILFVGLGCPKQETWSYDHYRVLNIPILAVGAAFDFIAGVKPQAPKWMQSAGLEWLFRLLSEPRRLWRRYLLINPAFLFLLAAQLVGLRRFDR